MPFCDGKYRAMGSITVDLGIDGLGNPKSYIQVAYKARKGDCDEINREQRFKDHTKAHELKHLRAYERHIDGYNTELDILELAKDYDSLLSCNAALGLVKGRFGLTYAQLSREQENHTYGFSGERRIGLGCSGQGHATEEYFCGEHEDYECEEDTY